MIWFILLCIFVNSCCFYLGTIIVSDTPCHGIPHECDMRIVESEKELFISLLDLVNHHDPDIIAGYEVRSTMIFYSEQST